jgi:predicted acetyltransferase
MVARQPEDSQPAQISIIPAAAADESVLANLLELYIYDFSDLLKLDLSAAGRFGYKKLPLYWQDPLRRPFLIQVDGQLAGFVLIKRGSEVKEAAEVWDMAEFFIMHRYRHRGIGTRVAHEVLRRFPGLWEIRVMEVNKPAYQFWRIAIAAFLGKEVPSVHVQKGEKSWHVFAFESASA